MARGLGAALFILFSANVLLAQTPAGVGPIDGSGGPLPKLFPVPFTGTLKPPKDPDHFRFLLIGDSRPAKARDPQPSVLERFFFQIPNHDPAFVLWTGDAIVGKAPSDLAEVACQYGAFLNLASGTVPIFMAPGNHEADDEEDEPDAAMQALYLEAMGSLYGAFDFGHSRFIALNTDEFVRSAQEPSEGAAAPEKTKPRGAMSARQIERLREDLEAHRGARHIFVFMHRPIYALKESNSLVQEAADALKALFQDYPNVHYVLSSHEHLYYNPQSPEDYATPPQWPDTTGNQPLYLVSGGGGAPLMKDKKTHARAPGAFYHYLIFEVDGDQVRVRLKCTDPKGCGAPAEEEPENG
jgi:hypothetical protein